ncbi:MAG: transcriptional repressor LexA [Chlamydiota bacterium]|nr:transcriptional repressor LexA [Chlamydiota bacterium]
MQELSHRQREILEWIARSQIQHHQTPTLHEIREHFGLQAIGTVQDHLEQLEKKGYLRRTRKARDIIIKAKARRALGEDSFDQCMDGADSNIVSLAILGQVAAGQPLFSEENQLGRMDIDKSLIRTKEGFLLQVQGESMIEAHIQDGDYVIVHPQKDAEVGQIVVALVDGEATVKRFYRGQGKRIILKPENTAMDPIVVDVRRVEIVGEVVGVIRKY